MTLFVYGYLDNRFVELSFLCIGFNPFVKPFLLNNVMYLS